MDQWAAHHQVAHNFEPVPGLLVPHPEPASWSARYSTCAREASWADIVRFLDAEAPVPNRGFWSHTTVRRMVHLRTYLGEVTQQGDEMDLINTAAHLPLVDRDLFRTVQAIEKGVVKRTRGEAQHFPLSGKVYCAGCSWRMGGGTVPRSARCGPTRGTRCPGIAHGPDGP